MIKIIHIADLHLDSPFANLSPSEREKRRNEQRQALSDVCGVCRREKADVLLVAGDLFDGDFIRSDTPAFAAECFASVPETQVFISPGNHDPYGSRSPYRAATFPDNVHIFTSEELSHFDLPQLNTTVYGYAFEKKTIKGDPIGNFKVADPSRINLLCAHCELCDTGAEYCGISESSIVRSGLDYAALGHIHAPGGFKKLGKTTCAYSGCLVGRGFDECGARGYIIGEIHLGGSVLKYKSLGLSRYERIEVDLEALPDEQEQIREIKERTAGFDKRYNVRVILKGSVRTEPDLTSGRFPELCSALSGFEIVDETVVIPDLSALMTEQSLRGEFCRRLRPHLESDDPDVRRRAALALKYGMRAIEG